jgi:ABC-type transporter Mla MlaB component
MAYQPDVDAVAPALEMTIDYITPSLICSGRLDAQTRRNVLEAVEELLDRRPSTVTVDVRKLQFADPDGANTLVQVQREARAIGVKVDWIGLDADCLRDGVPCSRIRRNVIPSLSTPTLYSRRPTK